MSSCRHLRQPDFCVHQIFLYMVITIPNLNNCQSFIDKIFFFLLPNTRTVGLNYQSNILPFFSSPSLSPAQHFPIVSTWLGTSWNNHLFILNAGRQVGESHVFVTDKIIREAIFIQKEQNKKKQSKYGHCPNWRNLPSIPPLFGAAAEHFYA